MNRIVKDHYPASKLPEDLREGIDPSAEVVVTVEEVDVREKALTIEQIVAVRSPPFLTKEEIDSALRADRDAWDA